VPHVVQQDPWFGLISGPSVWEPDSHRASLARSQPHAPRTTSTIRVARRMLKSVPSPEPAVRVPMSLFLGVCRNFLPVQGALNKTCVFLFAVVQGLAPRSAIGRGCDQWGEGPPASKASESRIATAGRDAGRESSTPSSLRVGIVRYDTFRYRPWRVGSGSP
jgi:hypothetical protein